MLWRWGRICGRLLAQGLSIKKPSTSVSRLVQKHRTMCWQYTSVSEVKLRQYHFYLSLPAHSLTASLNLPETEGRGFWHLVTVVKPQSNALRQTWKGYQWVMVPPLPVQPPDALWYIKARRALGRILVFLPWRYQKCKCQNVNVSQRFPLSVIFCRSPDSDSCSVHAALQVPVIRKSVFSNYPV